MLELTLGIMLTFAEVKYNDIPSMNREPDSLRQRLVKAGPVVVPYMQIHVAIGGDKGICSQSLIDDIDRWIKVKKLLETLSDDKFHVRQAAFEDLRDMGVEIEPFLVEALKQEKELDKKRLLEKLVELTK